MKILLRLFILLCLLFYCMIVYAKEKSLKEKLDLFAPAVSGNYGGFKYFSLDFIPADGYEVSYYADGFLQEKKNHKDSVHFFLKNPLNKDTLEPVEHKFIIRDLTTGETLEKIVILGVFDKEHNTFVPDSKGADFDKLAGRFYRARTNGDSMPPAIGDINWANWKKPPALEVKAADDEGIKSIDLILDGKKYSNTNKKEKAFISGESYFLKLPNDNKEHKYAILVTDTSGNSKEMTYNSKTRTWE